MSRLSMSIRYTIKDRPKGQPGYTGCNVCYGKDHAVSLSRMVYAILIEMVDHHAQFESVETINTELDALRNMIAGLAIHAGPVTHSEHAESAAPSTPSE